MLVAEKFIVDIIIAAAVLGMLFCSLVISLCSCCCFCYLSLMVVLRLRLGV